MAIITLANPKGGSGKTSTVILLSTELAHRGYKVAVVDADPEQHTTKWGERADANGEATLPENITLITALDPDQLVDDILDAHDAGNDFVIVDPQGKADDIMSSAMSVADLVLVPISESAMDQESSYKPLRRLRQEARKGNRVDHYVLFTQTPRVERLEDESLELRQIRADLERDGIEIFPRKVHIRSAIKKLNRYGGSLYGLRDKGYGGDVSSAVRTAKDLADGILCHFNEQDIAPEMKDQEVA